MFNPLKLAGGAVKGLVGGLTDDSEEQAKKAALRNLSNNYYSQMGSGYRLPDAMPEKESMFEKVTDGVLDSALGGLASDDDKDKELPWYKQAARGFLGK